MRRCATPGSLSGCRGMGRRARLSTGLVVLALMAGAASDVRAESVPVERAPLGGPVLTDSGVAWVAPDAQGAELWEAGFGHGGPARIQAFTDGEGYRFGFSVMAGSSELVAVAVVQTAGVADSSHVAGAA